MNNDAYQNARNAAASQQLHGTQISANPYPQSVTIDAIGNIGIGTTSVWGNLSTSTSKRSTHISIDEVENGRVVTVGGKQYIVAAGQPLIDVISQALVEAKLEE